MYKCTYTLRTCALCMHVHVHVCVCVHACVTIHNMYMYTVAGLGNHIVALDKLVYFYFKRRLKVQSSPGGTQHCCYSIYIRI